MDWPALLQDGVTTSLLGWVGGVASAWLAYEISNRRGTVSYSVNHVHVGLSQSHPVFGAIQVSLNGAPVQNLYVSTITVVNESTRDFDNLEMNVWSTNSALMHQEAYVDGAFKALELTPSYQAKLQVPQGQQPQQQQVDIFNKGREFSVPLFNRSEKIVLSFVNSPTGNAQPVLGAFIRHKGLRMVFRPPVLLVQGVPKVTATIAGMLTGLLFFAILRVYLEVDWRLAPFGFVYGVFAHLPGALIVRGYRWVRRRVFG